MNAANNMSKRTTYPQAPTNTAYMPHNWRSKSLDKTEKTHRNAKSRARSDRGTQGYTKLDTFDCTLDTFVSNSTGNGPVICKNDSSRFTDDSSHSNFSGENQPQFRETRDGFELNGQNFQNKCPSEPIFNARNEERRDTRALNDLERNIAEQMEKIGIDIDFNLESVVRKLVDLGESLNEEALQDVFGINDPECSISRYACYRVVMAVCTCD